MAEVQWSGSSSMAPWMRSRQVRRTVVPRPAFIRVCIWPVWEKPEAFSSPSVTTTWRKECSP